VHDSSGKTTLDGRVNLAAMDRSRMLIQSNVDVDADIGGGGEAVEAAVELTESEVEAVMTTKRKFPDKIGRYVSIPIPSISSKEVVVEAFIYPSFIK
jgi:hypothetical protein